MTNFFLFLVGKVWHLNEPVNQTETNVVYPAALKLYDISLFALRFYIKGPPLLVISVSVYQIIFLLRKLLFPLINLHDKWLKFDSKIRESLRRAM